MAPPEVPKEAASVIGGSFLSKLFSLEERTILVTGGARGLGICLATGIVQAGGDVVCLDILPEASEMEWNHIQELQASSHAMATYHRCDTTDEKSITESVAKAEEQASKRGKPIRGLIACAGIQQMLDAIEYPIDDFRRILEVNITGSFLAAKTTARIMRANGQQGSIVFIASMSGQIANRGIYCSAYNTSKAGVQQLTRSLATEWGAYGIRVNSLSPGYIRTAMTDQLLAEKPEIEEKWYKGALLGRLGAPQDFKAPALYLLSDGAAFMTGADLRVDGGHCASA